MPSLYRPRPGGSIEIVEEKAAANVLTDLNKRPESNEYVEPEDKFINDYIQQNSKRIQVKQKRDFLVLLIINFPMFRAHHQH